MTNQKPKIYDIVLACLPLVLYVLYFIYVFISVQIATSKPDYQEDYSGLGLIAVPVFGFLHYVVGGIVALALWGISIAVRKPINYVRTLWIAMLAPVLLVVPLQFL